MGPQTLRVYDRSFAGSTVTIDGIPITEFMDQENPIDIQDTETSNIEWDCEGKMVRTVKPSAILISVTVIPGSENDKKLREIWLRHFSNGGTVNVEDADRAIECTIQTGHSDIESYTFTNGTCVSGAAGVTANGQGKMGGNTYTFAFEQTKSK